MNEMGWTPPTLPEMVKSFIQSSATPSTAKEIVNHLIGQLMVGRVSKFPIRNVLKRHQNGGKGDTIWTVSKDGKYSLINKA